MPFDRLADGRSIVNPGSVGMPCGPAGLAAYWTLLGPDVRLRRTPYVANAVAERMRGSGWPGTEAFIEQNVLQGPPSDTEALALFTQWAKQRRDL